MPIQLPPRKRITSVLATIGLALFGLGLVVGSIYGIFQAADRRLRCDGAARTCEFTRHSLTADDVVTFDAVRVGEIVVTYPTKGSPSLRMAPERTQPDRSIGLFVTGPAAQDTKRQLEAMRDGEPAHDIDVVDNDRAGTTNGLVLASLFGALFLAAAVSETAAHARTHRAHRAGVALTPTRRRDPRPAAEGMPVAPANWFSTLEAVITPVLDGRLVALASLAPSDTTRRGVGWPTWVVAALTDRHVVFVAVHYQIHGFVRPVPTYRIGRVLAQWRRADVQIAEQDMTGSARTLFVQAPGWPLLELQDSGATLLAGSHANDRFYQLAVNDVLLA